MTFGDPPPTVADVRIGRRRDLSVATDPRPPVSWTVDAAPRARVSRAIARLDGREERVLGPDSVLTPWPFAPLSQGDGEHTLDIRVETADGGSSPWSAPLTFSEAFPTGRWTAPLLAHPVPPQEAAPLFLRREIVLPDDVIGATVLSTAQGVHRILVDGQETTDHVLAPGWTSYRDRLAAIVTDISPLIRPGARHVISVRAAGGWFTERYGFGPNAARVYGDQPAVSVRIRLRHADGRRTELAHDGWSVDPRPPLVASSLYAGEEYDARRENTEGMTPSTDLPGWLPARIRPFPSKTRVESLDVEPVRRIGLLPPVSVRRSQDGRSTIVDFGQNLVGRLRLRVDAPEGAVVTLRHAEVLEDDQLCTWPLRAATATDRLVVGRGDARVFEPEFAVHGFRYAEIEGLPAPLDPDAVQAVVIGSDLHRTGWFSSSDPLLDRLHENVVWSLRGNLLSVPTDCPQRDERLGWTGDAQVFAPAASSIFDVDAFFTSWLDDVASEQRRGDGIVPTIVPNPLGSFGAIAAAGWGDAIATVPTLLAERLGDHATRDRHAAAMLAWVRACDRLAGDDGLWERGFQYGDWLDPTASRPDKPRADAGLVASAYRIRSARLTAMALRGNGDPASAREADDIADRATSAFIDAYLTPRGRLMSDVPTAYALVLAFDIAPTRLRAGLAERLAFLLRAGGYRLATGFLGTPFVLDALLDNGQALAAERLLFQTMCPSWLYPVTAGATTVWERADAVRPDGSLHPSGMLSLNHAAFGAVADVLHRRIGGLAPAAPGYRRLRIRPWFPTVLDHAEVAHETPYGLARVRWERRSRDILVSAEIPPGVSADVVLPGEDAFSVNAGSHVWTVRDVEVADSHPLAGVDTDLAILADAPGACALISRMIADHSTEIGAEFDAYIRWVPGRTLRHELVAVSAPNSLVVAIDHALGNG